MKIKNLFILTLALLLLNSCYDKEISKYEDSGSDSERSFKELQLEWYAEELPVEDRKYFLETYQYEFQDDAYYAKNAIVYANEKKEGLRTAATSTEIENPEELLRYIDQFVYYTDKFFLYMLGVWQEAIEKHLNNEWNHVDFNAAIKISHDEFTRLQIDEYLHVMKNTIKAAYLKFDRSQLPLTFSLYPVLSQFYDLRYEGGMSFNEASDMRKTLKSRFKNIFYEAELEVNEHMQKVIINKMESQERKDKDEVD